MKNHHTGFFIVRKSFYKHFLFTPIVICHDTAYGYKYKSLSMMNSQYLLLY